MVCPNVPPLESLFSVLVTTRNERETTSFGTLGLSSGNEATRNAPDPPTLKISWSALSANATLFEGTVINASKAWPPPLGRNVTLTRRSYVCGLKTLSCVIQRVPNDPLALLAAGMTYVSFTCAARVVGMKLRTKRKTYLEAFITKPFPVPAICATVTVEGSFPVLSAQCLCRSVLPGTKHQAPSSSSLRPAARHPAIRSPRSPRRYIRKPGTAGGRGGWPSAPGSGIRPDALPLRMRRGWPVRFRGGPDRS